MEIKIDREELSKAALRRKRYLRNSMLAAPLVGASLCAAAEYKRNSTIEYKKEISAPEVPQQHSYSEMLPFFAFYTIATYLVLDGMKKFGGFRIWDALKYNFFVLKYGLNRIIRNEEKAHLSDKEFSKYIKDPLDKQLVLAGIDIREGKIDLAFERYDTLQNTLYIESIPVSLVDRISSLMGNGLAYLFEKKDSAHFISKALEAFNFVNLQKAKRNLEKAVEVENSAEINLLYAYFLNLTRDRKKGEQFAKTASIIKSDPNTEFKPIGETKNIVNIISGEKYISKGFVVKRNESFEHLQRERELIDIVASQLKDPRFCLPTHLGEIELRDDKYESYMIRDKGHTLLQRIKQKHPNLEKNLEDIADFLAEIYCAIPSSMLSEETSDISFIVDRMKEIDTSLDTIMQITDNLIPVINSFEDSPLVYKKDPTPLNWGILPDETIEAFDFEPAPAIRLEKDLVDLTDLDSFSEELKDKIHKRVISIFNAKNIYGFKVDVEKSKLALRNGVLLRAFNLYSRLSRSKSKRKIKEDLIKNANNALARIEKEFPDYYKSYKENYEELKAAISQLI